MADSDAIEVHVPGTVVRGVKSWIGSRAAIVVLALVGIYADPVTSMLTGKDASEVTTPIEEELAVIASSLDDVVETMRSVRNEACALRLGVSPAECGRMDDYKERLQFASGREAAPWRLDWAKVRATLLHGSSEASSHADHDDSLRPEAEEDPP